MTPCTQEAMFLKVAITRCKTPAISGLRTAIRTGLEHQPAPGAKERLLHSIITLSAVY